MQTARSETAEIELLYRQHGSALLLFATAVAGERSRAQDAVHQVFLKLLEARSLNGVQDTKAYLFTSVRNAILNDIRARRSDAALEDKAAWFDPPNRDYSGEQNLRRALNALPDDQRQATILHVWGELTFAQVAEVLGISANTAASRYRYALAKLREAMEPKEKCCADSQ
jgi:RNA polymerase sigma-70 factor (ECF subfamily)